MKTTTYKNVDVEVCEGTFGFVKVMFTNSKGDRQVDLYEIDGSGLFADCVSLKLGDSNAKL